MKKISGTVSQGGQRLDVFLATFCAGEYSRARIQRCIREGHATLNGKPCTPGQLVRRDDAVTLTVPDPRVLDLTPRELPLEILYEDADLLVVNKAPGMVVHPGAGNWDNTLVHALLAHCGGSLSGIGGVERPGIVHRLDKDTSGCILVAKNDFTHQRLTRLFHDREDVEKYYQALVLGRPTPQSFRIDLPIGRHPVHRKKMAINPTNGKNALTLVRVLARFRHHAHLECRIMTGRTHQIRVHLAHKGLPILGDAVYGRAKEGDMGAVPARQMLHAHRIVLPHPRTEKRLELTAPLPADFREILEKIS
ncbi:MAG: RluA family pseudouridine synthase [Verrucomicrobiae bacterium]|nr:RluA family pseudouridine synthase [Verrucomicrobiae bacterium]